MRDWNGESLGESPGDGESLGDGENGGLGEVGGGDIDIRIGVAWGDPGRPVTGLWRFMKFKLNHMIIH